MEPTTIIIALLGAITGLLWKIAVRLEKNAEGNQ